MEAGHQWSVETVNGPCSITAAPLPNGKLAIRANGRIVAPPMTPDESESVFAVADLLVRIRRGEGGALELSSEPLPVVEVEVEPAAPVAVGGMSSDARISVVGLAFIIAALFLLVKAISFSSSIAEFTQTMASETVREVRDPSLMRLGMIFASLRGGARGEVLAALLLIVAATTLFFRAKCSPAFLEVTAWGLIFPPVYAMLLVDRVYHIQLFSALAPGEAAQSLEEVHAHGLIALITLVALAGVLLQLVRQLKIRAAIEES
jgi:hypothetical protein